MHKSVSAGQMYDGLTVPGVDERFRSFILDFLEDAAQGSECEWVSEKTPDNVLWFRELMDLFPHARFLEVVRDPRAIVASLLRVGARARSGGRHVPKRTRDLAHAIKYTKRSLKRGRSAGLAAPGRMLTITFEDLVRAPETETRQICRFLELEWSDRMLTPERWEHPAEKTMTCDRNAIWYDRQSFIRPISEGPLYRWREELTEEQAKRIEEVFVADFGYLMVDGLECAP